MTNIKEVLEERGKRYGEFKDHAFIAQTIKGVLLRAPSWKNLSDSQGEALDMIAHKMARIVNGDPNYIDSWVDIIGYAQLVVNELQDNEKFKAEADAKKAFGSVLESI